MANTYLNSTKIMEVDVLLATKNGGTYINEFLDSLKKQNKVKINLIVSDDASTDETLKVIESHRGSFNDVLIFSGPQKGPKENFFYLLQHAKSMYIAFADQDDIWHPDHLIASIAVMNKHSSSPTLVFSQCEEFRDAIAIGRFPKTNFQPTLEKFIFSNYARGCTMVFNNLLLKKIKIDEKNAIMHDWWLALVAFLCGNVVYIESCHIRYRLHDRNFVGLGGTRLEKILNLLRVFRLGVWNPLVQINALSSAYPEEFKLMQSSDITKKLLQTQQTGNFISRFKFASKTKGFRPDFLEDLIVRMLLLRSWKIS
jgi:glycosyltransferase involved in cell wall biosynthesis